MVESPENDIDRQAAEWVARTEGATLSERDQAAFDAWLAADVRHVGAYAKATAVLAQLDRLRAAGMPPGFVTTSTPSRRKMVWGAAVAASLMIVVAIGGFSSDWLNEQRYSTKLGETRVVSLSDGSTVTLNTDTEVAVRYTKTRRTVHLLRGEALYDVAKHRPQPFVVVVHDVNVRAVGTSFAVRTSPGEADEILVREGVVEVNRPATPTVAPIRLRAGWKAVVPSNAPFRVSQVSVSRIAHDLAWTGGRLAFEDETLASAAREFARFSKTRIVITDPSVASRTITGLFVSNDPVGFSKAVAISLNLNVEVRQEEVRLTPKVK